MMEFAAHIFVFFALFSIATIGLNFIIGYSGMLTLSQASYFAIGGYTVALLTVAAGWNFFPAALAGILVASGAGGLSSLLAWRLKGDFLVLGTLAVQVLVASLLQNWASLDAPLGSWGNLTNGSVGIGGIAPPRIGEIAVSSPIPFAIFSLAVLIPAVWIALRLAKSPWTRLLKAVRDDELAARSIGKNVAFARTQAFIVGAAFTGAAGALYAAYVGYLDPTSASLDQSILLLSMLIVGGSGNVAGPVIGAAILVLLPEALRSIDMPEASAANWRLLIYGLLLVLVVHFRPSGLSGDYRVG